MLWLMFVMLLLLSMLKMVDRRGNDHRTIKCIMIFDLSKVISTKHVHTYVYKLFVCFQFCTVYWLDKVKFPLFFVISYYLPHTYAILFVVRRNHRI